MAKGKKGKKEKKEVETTAEPQLSEVDKTFYELQITDLNRKLSRLRELTTSLEEKNSELEAKYNKLDEDRNDIIAYLKRTLGEKQNEATELQERLVALREEKTTEAEKFEATVKDMEEEYKTMKDQLTSEIKLITGKLNALEEFRIQREDLMNKFQEQEKAIEEQEIVHKRTLYEAEKTFIMSKDTIKKEMEKRILQLAADFQSANEIRIAATTRRTIRENIALNNKMDQLIELIERLTTENETMKTRNRELNQNCELYIAERNRALGDSNLHKGIVSQLKQQYTKLSANIDSYEHELKDARHAQLELKTTKQDIIYLNHKIRVLEQNLHATKCQEFAAKDMLSKAEAKVQQLKEVLFEAIKAIEDSLNIQPSEEESSRYAKRESLLHHLLNLITEGKRQAVRSESIDTIETIAATYIRGDLGFTPKFVVDKGPTVLKFHLETQVGRSLEDIGYDANALQGTTSEDVSAESYGSITGASQLGAYLETPGVVSTASERSSGGSSSSSASESKKTVTKFGAEEAVSEEERVEEEDEVSLVSGFLEATTSNMDAVSK